MGKFLNKKTIGGIFLLALILLIFFSNTIYAYNLPNVTGTRPQRGRLSKLEMSTGIADYAHVENLYAVVSGTVEEMLVREGDYVLEGQAIMRLSFDEAEAERRLRELQNSRGKLHNEIQSLNLQVERVNRSIASLQEENYTIDKVSSYDLDILSIQIRTARSELNYARDQYDEGTGEDDEKLRMEVDNKRAALQRLQLQYEETARKLEEQEQKAQETYVEREKSRQSQLVNYQADIASLQLQLQSKNIDLAGISLQEEPYKKALEDYETYAEIVAPADGSVLSLGIGKGEVVRDNQLIAAIGTGGEFVIECTVSLDNNFIVPGDACELSNATHSLRGVVTRVKPEGNGKTVSVEFISYEVTPGETFDVTFSKDSTTQYTLVPSGALRQDNDGYFVNQIRRRNGILGDEYYLQRVDVYIGDSDSRNTAIVQGITFFEPIALVSDKAVSPGDIISLENASDFFER